MKTRALRLIIHFNNLFNITHWKYTGNYRYSKRGVQELKEIDIGAMGSQFEDWEDVNIKRKDLLKKP